MASDPVQPKLRAAVSAGASVPSAGAARFVVPAEVLDEVVDGLAGCEGTVLSETVCGGILDPNEVEVWVDRATRLLRFRVDPEELRSEVPAVADGLHQLMLQVTLPEPSTPDALVLRFLHRLVDLRQMLSLDVEAAFSGDPAAKGYDEIVVAYPSIRALAIHRIAHELYGYGVPLLPRVMSEYAHDRTGIDIHPGAQIGERFFVDHGTGIVIGETAVIGHRVRLYQSVTIGATSIKNGAALRGKKRHPTIEDDVTIYAGATILGGDTVIGAGSVIGGNVWLTHSVPPGSRVMSEAPHLLVKGSEGRALVDETMDVDWNI
ncbi:MAG: serine O-acetyltransferase EpsC [Myxococcota bacterium]